MKFKSPRSVEERWPRHPVSQSLVVIVVFIVHCQFRAGVYNYKRKAVACFRLVRSYVILLGFESLNL